MDSHRQTRLMLPAIALAAGGLLYGCARPVTQVAPAAERRPQSVEFGSATHEPPQTPGQAHSSPSPNSPSTRHYTVRELGQSVQGRAITMHVFGSGTSTTLIFAAIHGNERSAAIVAETLVDYLRIHPDLYAERSVAVIPIANPDGYFHKTRTNANRVDLNRNFPADNWRGGGRPGRYSANTHAASEPETRAIIRAVESLRPDRVISIHNISGRRFCNNFDGPAESHAWLMHAHNGYPVKATIGYPTPGSFGSWAGRDAGIPVITLELPRGESAGSAWEANREALLAVIRAAEDSPRRATADRTGLSHSN